MEPYLRTTTPNEPVPILRGPFELTGPESGTLNSDLVFRWVPTRRVEFDGTCAIRSFGFQGEWNLESSDPYFEVPVLISNASFSTYPTPVRGFLNKPASFGVDSFQALRFCLVNFPDYIGDPVGFETSSGRGAVCGRLGVDCDLGRCRLDCIQEAKEAVELAKREGGYVITHVGEWTPESGLLTVDEAQAAMAMLRVWFGLLAASWTGPVFPEGVTDGVAVWHELAPWKLGEGRFPQTWMPQRTRLRLTDGFQGFVKLWNDDAWQRPLKYAVSWLVEANSPGTAIESRVVLSQVALELLSWTYVVESERLQSRSDFKRLSAAGRIRILLQALGVPAPVPDYMTELPRLFDGDAYDGPGVITRVRNALVHAAEDNRNTIASMDARLWLECSQLAIQYVELCLLAICGHTTEYARRGWRGWKGDDEVQVPWTRAG